MPINIHLKLSLPKTKLPFSTTFVDLSCLTLGSEEIVDVVGLNGWLDGAELFFF